MKNLYLGLGTNLGDKAVNLNTAIEELSKIFGAVVKCSGFYKSKPWGFSSKNDFLNAVVVFAVDKSPIEILTLTQQIEQSLGRKDKTVSDYADRLIDIDILLLDNVIINSPKLIIPHPLMLERDFVMKPMLEIAPYLTHPVVGKTFRELELSENDSVVD